MLDFETYHVLTFDCYGTLVDWENGIVRTLGGVLGAHGIRIDEEDILGLYGEFEAELERAPYQSYRAILRRIVERFGETLGFEPLEHERGCLVNSIGDWPVFPDTIEALRVLARRYRLAVITNTDDDLFARTAERLDVSFDWVITAERAKAYKPSQEIFKVAFDCIGVSLRRILHIAQSMYHDVVPAKSLGLSAVWVNRRGAKRGSGATKPAVGHPDLEVPDLRTLVALMGLL